MELVLGLLFFLALFAVRIAFWVWRSKEAAGPGGDPHEARALEDSFKDKDKRGRRPAGGRQIAGEDCDECEESIIAEKEGTACGLCDVLLHKKRCAKRHVCANARAASESAQPYRE